MKRIFRYWMTLLGSLIFWTPAYGSPAETFGTQAGQMCAISNVGIPPACRLCVETACKTQYSLEADMIDEYLTCINAGWPHCDASGPNSEPAPQPVPVPVSVPDADFVPSLAALQTGSIVVVSAGVGAGTGYVVYTYGGKILGFFSPAASIAGWLIGVPIILGTTAGNAFANYVDNYQTGIDNGVTGSGATGSGQCPDGEQPQTGVYGTACVPIPGPQYPACSSLATCASLSASGNVCESGPTMFQPVPMKCFEDGLLTTVDSCLMMCSMGAGAPPPPPPPGGGAGSGGAGSGGAGLPPM